MLSACGKKQSRSGTNGLITACPPSPLAGQRAGRQPARGEPGGHPVVPGRAPAQGNIVRAASPPVMRTASAARSAPALFPGSSGSAPGGQTAVLTGATGAQAGSRLSIREAVGALCQIPWPGFINVPGRLNIVEPDIAWYSTSTRGSSPDNAVVNSLEPPACRLTPSATRRSRTGRASCAGCLLRHGPALWRAAAPRANAGLCRSVAK